MIKYINFYISLKNLSQSFCVGIKTALIAVLLYCMLQQFHPLQLKIYFSAITSEQQSYPPLYLPLRFTLVKAHLKSRQVLR